MKTPLILASLAIAFGFPNAAHAVTFDWAQIGNAGNAGELSGGGAGGFGPDAIVGAVAYDYEVTNTQYVEFLNGVATSDPFGLYNTFMGSSTQVGITRSGSSGSYTYAVKADAAGQGPGGADYTYADKPVVYVSWYDSVRFTNWLHNGQGDGDTETGAYTLLGGTTTPSNALGITRNADALYWLPSEDEWYKAAYHDASAGTAGTYFDFATGANTAPNNNLPSADTGNSVNHDESGNSTYPLTDVGAYGLSGSPYGTYDQNGNAWEWNETLIDSFSLSSRSSRGGSWPDLTDDLAASGRIGFNPASEHGNVGFRVATLAVPEPSSLLLLLSLASGILLPSRR